MASHACHRIPADESWISRMARARCLRPRTGERDMARRGTSLLPNHVASLLVVYPAPVPRQETEQRLGSTDLPRPRRHRDDDALRLPDLLRPAPLPLVQIAR